jgi:hypothetical protein
MIGECEDGFLEGAKLGILNCVQKFEFRKYTPKMFPNNEYFLPKRTPEDTFSTSNLDTSLTFQ